jgi:hypothetical protein
VVDRPPAGHTGAMINLGNRLLASSTPHLEHVRRWYQQVGNARHSHASVL